MKSPLELKMKNMANMFAASWNAVHWIHVIPLKVRGIHAVDQVLQQQLTNQNNQERKKWKLQKINPLKTNGRLLYLKARSVPRSEHFSSQL
jgi:hypothetical protein